MKKHKKIICKICGKVFYIFPSRNNKYCCRKCYLIDQPNTTRKLPVKHICKWCKKVTLLPQHIAKHRIFCSVNCANKFKSKNTSGSASVHWKGGYIDKAGYKQIKINGRYVGEHIYVYEKHYGIKIKKGFVVHHKDENRSNNKISNLQLMTNSRHVMLHGRKITPTQHKEIISLYKTGKYSHKQLGEIFGIDKSGITRYLNGERILLQYFL